MPKISLSNVNLGKLVKDILKKIETGLSNDEKEITPKQADGTVGNDITDAEKRAQRYRDIADMEFGQNMLMLIYSDEEASIATCLTLTLSTYSSIL